MDQNTIQAALQRALANGTGTLDDLDALLDRAKSDILKAKEEARAKEEAAKKAAEAEKLKRGDEIAKLANRLLQGEPTDEDVALVLEIYLKSKGLTDVQVSAEMIRDSVDEGQKRSEELSQALNELAEAFAELLDELPQCRCKSAKCDDSKNDIDNIDKFLRQHGLR